VTGSMALQTRGLTMQYGEDSGLVRAVDEVDLNVLRLFEELRTAGQTRVVVTHDPRIAAVADRVIAMRDGAFADDNRLVSTATGTVYDGWR
jgi:predicted ABC-type transport system involved in lysophospholipase L1 biosynthesis ATPase subunit